MHVCLKSVPFNEKLYTSCQLVYKTLKKNIHNKTQQYRAIEFAVFFMQIE